MTPPCPRRLRAALAAAFVATVGSSGACGQGDPAEVTGASGVRKETQPAAEPVSERCTAGATRDCTLRFVDARNQEHCLPATQFCATDGESWLACGERPEGDAGAAGD